MRLLIKESEPTGGEIRVAGRDLAKIPRAPRAVLPPQPRRGLPGLQAAAEPHGLRERRLRAAGHGRQPARDPRQGAGHPAPDRASRTKLHNYPDQLSGGEQQRVSVARAFVNHPPLLIADEPTGNLDPETSIGIMQLLYRINRTGTTVLVATHDVAMVDKMRRRVIELADGRIVRDEQAGAYAARENTREFADPDAERPGMRPGFFLREALRALKRNAVPSFAAMATVLVTVLVLGVFIPVVQATTGAANEVRGKVIADVYLKTDAKQADIDRVEPAAQAPSRWSSSVEFVSKEQALRGPSSKRNPKAYELLGSNPLPDTFRVTPDKPGRHRQDPRRARAAGAGRRAHGRRPRDRRGPQPRGGHEQDPLGHARGEAHDGAAGGPARRRLDAADRQHDPAVALRPPPRGRGDEARRRDRLVHPLAVRARGRDRRRARRRAGDPAARRGRRSRWSTRWPPTSR